MQKLKNGKHQSMTKLIDNNLIFFKIQNFSPCSLFEIFRFQNVFFKDFFALGFHTILGQFCPPKSYKKAVFSWTHSLMLGGLHDLEEKGFLTVECPKQKKNFCFLTKISFWDVKVKFPLFLCCSPSKLIYIVIKRTRGITIHWGLKRALWRTYILSFSASD